MECPFLDTSHSEATLYYFCKLKGGRFEPGEMKKLPCTNEYSDCSIYQKTQGADSNNSEDTLTRVEKSSSP